MHRVHGFMGYAWDQVGNGVAGLMPWLPRFLLGLAFFFPFFF